MSKTSPKKQKQTKISDIFPSPKKEMVSESGKSSEDSDSKKMKYSFKKEVGEGPSKHLQQEAEVKTLDFQYCLNKSKRYSVSCKASLNVLEALNTSHMFRNEKEKNQNKQKEILIQRSKDGVPGAAVKTDFPCCLIETNEILYIDFIQKDENSCTNQTTAAPLLRKTTKPEMLVTFQVKKEGGQKVRCLLKSKALRSRVKCVCVYAFKGEKIKNALKRDGRFIDDIFGKHCALSEFNDELKHEWSKRVVENIDGKSFQLVVLSDKKLPDSQDDLTPVMTEPNVASDADVAETVGSSQNPISNEQEKKHDGNTESTNPPTTQCAVKPIADSEEILGILRDQFPVLLKQLKQRENLKSKSDVQKFFRAEYGKSVENFLKVKKVKQLMKLSDSVCQIRQGDSALGTGFLLFDRYILTNAHVITDVTKVNAGQYTAVFGYEDLDSKDNLCISVTQLTSFFKGKDDKGMHLDYALLKLDNIDKIADYPKLLDYYCPNAPINRGQICIVGHPGEGVKKMDPCFIIEKENQQLIHIVNEQKQVFPACENQITYDSCFFNGSSGSPVFDVDCNLIGIHTGGYTNKTGDKIENIMEYGFSMQPILDNIRAQARMKGLPDIVSVIDAYTNSDVEMKDAEESDEL
ncbi:serine protease FAM111A-like isoform X2 [Carassius carassius]|uniref:serine protease FAM111A-like isoform X2 n=1 Tax=Carassius carassius TaxID=217509 RepID=UPI002869084C|nr:serine protease FAM111A-like isoform X2 [Carassius carassius]